MSILETLTNALFGRILKEENVDKQEKKPEQRIVPGENIVAEVDKTNILSFVNSIYNYAYQVKKQHIEIWDTVWAYYNNQYDFSQKASWQSKMFTTKFNASIKTFLTIVKRSVMGTKKFFSVQGIGNESKQKQLNVERLLEYWISKTNFRHELTKSIIAGLLSNLCILKCYWNNGIQIECVDPYLITLDPTGRNKFVIHQIKLDFYDVKRMAEKGVFDINEVNQIQEDFVRAEIEYKEAQRRGETDVQRPSFRKEVEIMEYYGDVFDNTGNLLLENVIITIANGSRVLRVVPNPYPIRPFFIAPLNYKPFSVYHKNFYEDVIRSGLVEEMAKTLNGIVDGHLFSIAKAFELNIDVIYDPEEIKSGISPGKVFKRIGGSVEPMVREINIGNISQQNLAVYEILSREFQNATAITEFIMGMPTAKGRPTATEVMYKSQQAVNTLQDISADLENYLIAPLLEFMFDLIMKYQTDFSDAELQEFLGDHLDYYMDFQTFKDKYLNGVYKFKIQGLSSTMLRMQLVEKISMLLTLLQANPLLASRLNWQQLLYKILEGLELDPTEILMPAQETSGPEQPVIPTSPQPPTTPVIPPITLETPTATTPPNVPVMPEEVDAVEKMPVEETEFF